MAVRSVALLLSLLVLAGCTAPPPGPAEATAPVSREGRLGNGSTEPAEPVIPGPEEWDDRTPEVFCVSTPSGCMGACLGCVDGRHVTTIGSGTSTMTITVTWDAVDDTTKVLRLSVGRPTVEGPSPLTLDLGNVTSARGHLIEISVKGIEEGTMVHLPAQPFHVQALQS
jgi:hypothetical protein